MDRTETVEEAAKNAARRWRLIAIGLAIVGATNLVNVGLNYAGLRGTVPGARGAPMCVTIVGVPVAKIPPVAGLSEKPGQ